MRFAHISDMHLGLTLNGHSFMDDQEFIMNQISDIILESNVDVVFISGDIYDKPLPPERAVSIFNIFISKLSQSGLSLYIIPGNHDSVTRLSFGADILRREGVYIAKQYNGSIERYKYTDDYGDVNIYLLPFVKPVDVRHLFPDVDINDDYTNMVKAILDSARINYNERNIILSHQFLEGSKRADNGNVITGMYDAVSPSVYKGFNYAAMGHLHNGQCVGAEHIRYSGTPLKYSKVEANNEKSVIIGEINARGEVFTEEKKLSPMRDMCIIKGTFAEIESIKTDDYVHVELKGADTPEGAFNILKKNMPNIMSFVYCDNSTVTQSSSMINDNIIGYFEEFFSYRMGRSLNEKERNILLNVID